MFQFIAQPMKWSSIGDFGVILTCIPQQVLLSRIKTIVPMWLYTNSMEADQSLGETDTGFVKLVLSSL